MEKLASSSVPLSEDVRYPRFMNVRQVADYLQLNEKKIYALVNESNIPATKVTGKWLFPRELIDRWLLESSHGGVLTDRMSLAGGDDPLLQRVLARLMDKVQAQANVSFSGTGVKLGLSLLARQRAEICTLHWGPAEESQMRHTALLNQYPQHRDWLLVRAFRREQGLMVRPEHAGRLEDLLQADLRWVQRQDGSGTQRFLQETLARHKRGLVALQERTVAVAHSQRDAASQVAMRLADVAPGTRGCATEFGLAFVPVGWECFDFALYRGVYFRKLFHQLLQILESEDSRALAERLGGYDLSEVGRVVWTA